MILKEKIVELLSDDSVEIIIRTHIPYRSTGLTEDYSVTDKISIGDRNITGYYGIHKENISQELMNSIKSTLINLIRESKEK